MLRALGVAALTYGEPIVKRPAGTTIISGQSLHSLRESPGLKARSWSRLSGVAFVSAYISFFSQA